MNPDVDVHGRQYVLAASLAQDLSAGNCVWWSLLVVASGLGNACL